MSCTKYPRLTSRGAATRERIVAGAAALIYERGVANTSLDDIMALTATSKSQLYHYFADKDALVLEVIRRQLDQVVAGQETELRELWTWEGLQRWRDHLVEGTRATGGVGGCPLGSLASELADSSDSAREALVACFAEWESYLVDGFSAMRQAGLISRGADPAELAVTVMTALQGGLLLAQTTRDIRPLELALDMAIAHAERYRLADHRRRPVKSARDSNAREVQGTPTNAPRMSAGRVPLFCDTALAARIERVEAQLIAQSSEAARRRAGAAGFVIPVAGGVASFAGDGSPFNKVAGLGFGGIPGPAALDEIERAFAGCGSPVQIELAHLADPAIGELLTGRGYRLESFENVLGRTLTDDPERVLPPGVEVRRSGAEESEAWLDVVAEGSIHPDTQGVPWHEEFPREMIIGAERDMAAAGAVRYAAVRDGVIAGGATMRIAEGVAQLTGAATAPAHRRRGVHTALLSARLA